MYLKLTNENYGYSLFFHCITHITLHTLVSIILFIVVSLFLPRYFSRISLIHYICSPSRYILYESYFFLFFLSSISFTLQLIFISLFILEVEKTFIFTFLISLQFILHVKRISLAFLLSSYFTDNLILLLSMILVISTEGY